MRLYIARRRSRSARKRNDRLLLPFVWVCLCVLRRWVQLGEIQEALNHLSLASQEQPGNHELAVRVPQPAEAEHACARTHAHAHMRARNYTHAYAYTHGSMEARLHACTSMHACEH